MREDGVRERGRGSIMQLKRILVVTLGVFYSVNGFSDTFATPQSQQKRSDHMKYTR